MRQPPYKSRALVRASESTAAGLLLVQRLAGVAHDEVVRLARIEAVAVVLDA